MITTPHGLRRRSLGSALTAATCGLALHASAAPSSWTDHDAYYPAEPIVVSFADGPGNPKDWVGIYPTEIVPGSVGSTIWNYVDGTQGGNTGLKEGTITFGNGLALAGDWVAYLLLNDGYTTLTTNTFKVVDPGTPLVRIGQRVYSTGQAITVTFTNGPAAAKDWVGIYKAGQTPGGGTPSTLWNYVDGTQTGATGRADGTVSFPSGLSEAGDYIVHLLANDGYDILASETFRVAAAVAGAGPRVLSSSPADGSSNQVPVLRFTASITNGSLPVVASSVTLSLDGTGVPATVTQSNGLTTVAFTSPVLPAPGSTHTWILEARDGGTPPAALRLETRTTIGAYRNLVLPAPLYFENFDAVNEGSLPAGWTGKSYTEIQTAEEDLGNLDSATYARWTTVAAQRFEGSFVTYSNPDNPADWGTDYRRVLTSNPFNVLNGSVLTGPLATGRFLFGNSGYRNGRSQVLYVSTPDYDLTGKTNVHVAFKSLWEQNQDSLALVEYSIDQGATWLPVAYLLDAVDVVRFEDGTVDAETTLGTERGDIARYTDEQGNELGGTYGAFVGAPITPALAPHIQARVDDDASGSKRVEFFPLPLADNRSKVRLRFGHAGTDSWYFGIDDFGLYSISASPEPPPSLTVTRTATQLVISWTAAAGAVLESSPSLSPAAWTPVSGVTGNSHSVAPSAAAAFYRLRR